MTLSINITRVTVDAEITCDHCGATYFLTVDDGDTYFSESQMVDAVTERLGDEGLDEFCPNCVSNHYDPELED